MAEPTYELIESVTLTADASEIEISNIPNTFRDLAVLASVAKTSASAFVFRFNNDSSPLYFYNNTEVDTSENKTVANRTGSSGVFFPGNDNIVNDEFGSYSAFIYDYAQTDKYKVLDHQVGNWGGDLGMAQGGVMYKSTNAIHTITFVTAELTDSTVHIYGIAG